MKKKYSKPIMKSEELDSNEYVYDDYAVDCLGRTPSYDNDKKVYDDHIKKENFDKVSTKSN